MQYLARYRMHRACTLLLGSERLIKQIGAEVGYPEIARFSTRFRKTIGASPQAYRQANK
jgi:YesN/AraC family two-component response regulator